MQYGQANFPDVIQLDSMSYAGKSLIVHISAPFNVKFCFLETSYVWTSTSCNCFNSSIHGCK